MSFPGVTSDNINAAVPVEAGGILTGIGAMVNPVAGIAGMLGGVGGLTSMFGGGGGSSDVARAGGTFYTGSQTYSKGISETGTILIVVAIALGLLVVFRGKK